MVSKVVGGGMEWELGVSRSKLLYIEWINNKVPLIAQGTIQFPVINHNGKEYFLKKNVYICITESL